MICGVFRSCLFLGCSHSSAHSSECSEQIKIDARYYSTGSKLPCEILQFVKLKNIPLSNLEELDAMETGNDLAKSLSRGRVVT